MRRYCAPVIVTLASLYSFSPSYAGNKVGEPMPRVSELGKLSLEGKVWGPDRGSRCVWTQQMYVGKDGLLDYLVFYASHNTHDTPFLIVDLKQKVTYVDNRDKERPGNDWIIDSVLKKVNVRITDHHPFCATVNNKPLAPAPQGSPQLKKEPSFSNSG